jgi:hypothetical protein
LRWTQLDPAQFGGVSLEGVTDTPAGHLVASGNWLTAETPDGTPRHPTMWQSVDGATWSHLPDSPVFVSRRANFEEIVLGIAADGPGIIAVGMEQEEDASAADAAAWFSPDGSTWTRATVADGADRTMDRVLAVDDGFVAIGEANYDFHGGFGGGTAVWTSTDGRTWARLPDTKAPPAGTRLNDIVHGPDGFLATASFEFSAGDTAPAAPLTDGIWTSRDAVHWQPIAGTPLGLRGLTLAAGRWYAVGTRADQAGADAPVIASSNDGRAWISVALPHPPGLPENVPIYPARLAAGVAGILVLGERGDDNTSVSWWSPDGASWASIALDRAATQTTFELVHPVAGSILAVGHRPTDTGSEVPGAWLISGVGG